jgi:Domain of unknown function (DUF1707)
MAASEGSGCGELRASHADRERVIGLLKTAFVQGMLAKDEFDQRVGQAFAARTHAELTAPRRRYPRRYPGRADRGPAAMRARPGPGPDDN